MSVPADHCLAGRSSVAIFRLSHPVVEAMFIASIAGSLRILWHFFGPASDTPDTAVYIDAGNALFATGQMTSTYYMPLYPIMIHVAGYYGIIWLQIIASSLTAAFVYLLADRMWNDRIAALGAGIICAAHPVLIFYANLRLSETVFIFLLILGLALIYRRAFALASIAFVLANLCRPTLDLIFPFIVAAGAIAALLPGSIEWNLTWIAGHRRACGGRISNLAGQIFFAARFCRYPAEASHGQHAVRKMCHLA